MALLVYYNQVRDEPTEVEYEFGTAADNLDYRLTIVKANRQTRTPPDQPEGLTRATAGRILHRHDKEGTWPPKGMIQA